MFLSSLAIIFPNANLSDQVDLPLKLHPAAIGALGLIRLAARWEQGSPIAYVGSWQILLRKAPGGTASAFLKTRRRARPGGWRLGYAGTGRTRRLCTAHGDRWWRSIEQSLKEAAQA